MRGRRTLGRLRSLLATPDPDGASDEAPGRTEPSAVAHMTDARTRSELCHELYVDVTSLLDALGGRSARRSLEVGCGFGRLTPWIADRADEHWAVDPDRSLLAAARREYPDVRFQRARVEALPFRDDAFDLAVTWGVLNHVPLGAIRAATAELDRVVAPGEPIVVSEATAGTPDPRWEYRSIDEWCELLAPRELVRHARTERDEEPFRDPDREHVVMTFR